MNDEALARSNAIRAYLIGHLLGVLQNTRAGLAHSSTPWLADAIDGSLKELYPLIEAEFYGGQPKSDAIVPEEETP